MITAVIYARYSSSNQREESIAGQLRECRQYATRCGMTVIHEYTDSALTGTSDKRPAFQQMIKDSDRHTFQAVIVWKLDRFARNRYDSAMYRNILKKNGVKIYSAMENISDSPEGIILEGLMESLAEYYSANLAENVKRGLYDSALERKMLSQPTYGYEKGSDGRYAINPVTAPVVQRIFSEYANGKPYMKIVADLNKDGIKTAQGKEFNKNSLRNILRNEKYTGMYRYKDIVDPHGIPAIVDRDLFDRVQKELKRRSFTKIRISTEDQVPYILTGKLFCGHCGKQMLGESARSKNGETYRYYICAGTRTYTKNGCTKKRVPKDWIEYEVIRILNEQILTDEIIGKLADAVMRFQETDHETGSLAVLKNSLKLVQKKLENILTAIEDGIWSETTNSRLQELEQQKSRLEQRIQEETIALPQFTREQVIAFLTALKHAEKTDSEAQLMLIDTCINRIFLFDDEGGQRLVIHINYSENGNEPVSHETVLDFVKSTSTPAFRYLDEHMTDDGQILIMIAVRYP